MTDVPFSAPTAPEPWLRGPVAGVPALLQPAAHALVHAREDVRRALGALGDALVHARPGGAASAAFHVRHAAGSLDRLLTYARGEALDDAQRAALAAESRDDGGAAAELVASFDAQVERALAQLRATPESALLDARAVGRLALPSTVIGLLFHAAEHTQRHVGQLVTTARVARALGEQDVREGGGAA